MERGKIFITVPQFAQAVGISQQAVYKQVKSGRLKQYAKKTGRQTKIDAAALVEIYEIDESKIDSIYQSTSDNKEKPESTSETTELQITLSILREQLIAKDRQIDDLSQRLREAHKLLNDNNEALKQLAGPRKKETFIYDDRQERSKDDVSGDELRQTVEQAKQAAEQADQERQRLAEEKNAADQERERLQAELQAVREQAAKDAEQAAEAARRAEKGKPWYKRLFGMD